MLSNTPPAIAAHWQPWRDPKHYAYADSDSFFIPIHASCSGCHDVGQGNVNICSTYGQIADLGLALSFAQTYRFNFV